MLDLVYPFILKIVVTSSLVFAVMIAFATALVLTAFFLLWIVQWMDLELEAKRQRLLLAESKWQVLD